MKKFFFLLAFLPLLLDAQTIDSSFFNNMKIRNLGPAGMSGRITAIDVPLDQPEVIYVGAASGGVWKSNSAGLTWEPIFDKMPVQSIGAIKIQQSNTDVIWVGTGEGNPRNSLNCGAGIYKSIDAGKTWQFKGLESTFTIHRIVIDHQNPDIVYVAALGSPWGNNRERGIFKTTDGGESWEKILYINDGTGAADMVMDPDNPNKILVAMWEHGRKPWFFNSGGPGSGMHLTYDGGKTWKKITDKQGLPKGNLGRIGIAIAPSKPDIIYALVEAKVNGLYKSTDGGEKWSLVSDKNIGNRPFYYSEIYVDPKNENRIWNLWSYVSKSEDGGKTFETILDYGKGVHPDHHAFWIHPDDSNYMINGNDGGMNISRDGGKNWRFVENLPVGQFYHINHDNQIPYKLYGGMQDNGTWVGPSSVWKRGGIRNEDWREILFGDGFDAMPKKNDPRYAYAMYQGGNVYLTDTETGYGQNIRPNHPEQVELRFNWNAALAQDPFSDCGIYFGSQFVHKSNDCGTNWDIISPDLTTNDTAKQKSGISGGLTIDATRAENYTTIICIAPSPLKKDLVWAGTDDGHLQLTKDGGKNWSELSSKLIGAPKGSWIPQIEVSKHDANEAFIVVNNYRKNDWNPYAYHTKDGGLTFRMIASNNQVEGYVRSIVQDPVEPNLLFLGTDRGLYVSIDRGSNWTKWKKGFPSAPVADMKIHPRDHDLIIATFGRAIWVLDNLLPLRTLAQERGAFAQKDFKVFETPDAYLASIRSVDGIRFTADATFLGANKYPRAALSYWVKPEVKKEEVEEDDKKKKKKGQKKEEEASAKKEDKKADEKPKKVSVHILNMEGDTIRTLSHKYESGLNKLTWGLDNKGVRYPSRATPKPDDEEAGGISVLPGTYKAIFSLGKLVDSTMITVHADPRIPFDSKAQMAVIKKYQAYEKMVQVAYDGFERIKEVRKTIVLIDKVLEMAPDSTKKDMVKMGKEVTTQIDSLEALYMKPADYKGINSVLPNLNGTLYTASSYIDHPKGPNNSSTANAIEKAELEVKGAISGINALIEGDWMKYREAFEKLDFPLFKDFEKIEFK